MKLDFVSRLWWMRLKIVAIAKACRVMSGSFAMRSTSAKIRYSWATLALWKLIVRTGWLAIKGDVFPTWVWKWDRKWMTVMLRQGCLNLVSLLTVCLMKETASTFVMSSLWASTNSLMSALLTANVKGTGLMGLWLKGSASVGSTDWATAHCSTETGRMKKCLKRPFG